MPLESVFEFNEFVCVPVFAFNKDFSRVAISPNNENIMIYIKEKDKWTLQSTLTEHTERVTGLDWAPNNKKLLSCGADRNAYVWSEDKPNEWSKSLVLLRIDRAAIMARWAPNELKFAVGTGSKLVCVCYYEESNDWWVSKHIKKPIRSSVLSIDWHHSSSLIAVGSSDFRVRIYAAGVKEVEKKPEATKWGEKLAFGTVLAEFTTLDHGWAHSVAFSPDGNKLCWVSHDAVITVADNCRDPANTFSLKLTFLPLLTCLWCDDSTILAAGHDNAPYKFSYDGKEVKLIKCIDGADSKKQEQQTQQSAMNKFKNLDKFAQTGGSAKTSDTTHSNTVKLLRKMQQGKFASSGVDNKLAIWANV